jgi:hypothetical protein
MKLLKPSVLARVALVLLLLCGCGGSGGSDSDYCPVPDDGKTVIYVGWLDCFKRDYKVGETFNTAGDTLYVQYSDGTSEWINCGFTQEWMVEWDEDVVTPIKHGDPLPIKPYQPSMGLARFYVRAVYRGFSGHFSYRTVGY